MPTWTPEQTEAIYKNGSNILVSAGAGSGKTAVLSERVIEILKQNIHIDELLILTFTNAAAKEMKERIRKKIKKIPELKEELDRIDASYITTFDSFCLSIVKKYHYKKNISSSPKILNASIMQYQKKKFLDEIFLEYYESQDSNFLNLMNLFCVKNDEILKKYLLQVYEKIRLKVNFNEFLDTYTDTHYAEPFKKKLEHDYQFLIEEKLSYLKEILEILSQYTDGEYIAKLEDLISPFYEHDFTVFPTRLPSLPKESSEETKKTKDEFKKVLDEIKELTKKTSEEHYLDYEKTKETSQVIFKIIRHLNDKMDQFKHEKDVFEFLDIELLALHLIEEFPDIREDLKNKFHEIMIDEYQDTNDLQEYLISLISKNNVYMVGDIKQSIYRFRNANPYLFKDKYDSYKQKKGGIKIDLKKNFRSREEVITDINQLFSKLMNDSIGGADYVTDHQMMFGNQVYTENKPKESAHLELICVEDTKKIEETEATYIASDICEKIQNHFQVIDKDTFIQRDCEPKDFAVLLDRVTYADTYLKVFEKYHLPLHVNRDESVNENDLFMVLKNLFSILFEEEYEKQKFLYTSIARSFLIEETDQIIYETIQNNNIYETEIFRKINKLKSKIESMTSSKIVEELLEEFNVYTLLPKVGNKKANELMITTFLSLTKELEDLGYLPQEAAKILEEMTSSDLDLKIAGEQESKNSIELMTIHKSKGLEFPVCYFAGLKKQFNISDLKDPIYFDSNYGLIIPYLEDGLNDTICKTLMKENYIKEEIGEKVRLFYVALTRAREKMVFVSPALKEDMPVSSYYQLKERSFYDFLSSISKLIEPYIVKKTILEVENISKEEQTKTIDFDVEEIFIEKEILQTNSFSKKIHTLLTEEEKKNITFGLELHEIFETANLKDKEIQNPYLKRFLNQELLKNIDQAKIYQEQEFLEQEKHGIIDLMLEYEDHIDIIDYKLSQIEDEAYLIQLKGYQKYVLEKKQKPVSLYLYSILKDTLKKVGD